MPILTKTGKGHGPNTTGHRRSIENSTDTGSGAVDGQAGTKDQEG